MAGYSGTPLPRKLGIRAGHRVGVWGGPPHLADLLAPLPDDVVLSDCAPGVKTRSLDVILAFVPREADLAPALAACAGGVTWEGGLWVCWPKKKSPLHTDLAEGQVRQAGLATGLVDNKICAVDDDWSGLRFVHRRENRPTAPGGKSGSGRRSSGRSGSD